VLSPILLKGRLHEPFYSEWVNLVNAITLATDYSISQKNLSTLHGKFCRFVKHYEEYYYRHDLSRIAACKPVFHALLHVTEGIEWLGPMWSYSQWVMERTCGLWTPRVRQKSIRNTDRHLSLITLLDTQITGLQATVNFEILTDQTTPTILRYLKRRIDPTRDEMSLEEGVVTQDSYTDEYHHSSFHTRAGWIYLTYAEVNALIDLLIAQNIAVPDELNHVRKYRLKHRSVSSNSTSIKVEAFKHLHTNNRYVEQALFNTYIRCKRFQLVDGRDATYARLDGHRACFGRMNYYFLYNIHPCVEEPKGATLMLACYEPINVFVDVNGLCRIRGGIPSRKKSGTSNAVKMVDADDVVDLLGVICTGDMAFFVNRDSCYL